MLAYVYDFLSVFFDKLLDRKSVRSVILFGSMARKEQRSESDIDLFVDVNPSFINEIQATSREAVNEFELRSERTWKLRGITHPFSVIVGDLQSEQWKELRNEMAIYGVVVYGRRDHEVQNKNRTFISYDLSRLKQHQKMAALRALFGYTLKKGKKVYRREGIVSSLHAEKLSNALLVDREHAQNIRDVLRKNNVKFREF
jgi:predicted nucleotidyltransferase